MCGSVPESVLRQWETMHRPPDTIPTSGPQYQRMGSGGGGMSRAGLIVPPPSSMGANGSSGSRRHSVISSPKDNIGSHYLQLARNGAGGKRSSGGSEMRRPSEVWLCKSIPLIFEERSIVNITAGEKQGHFRYKNFLRTSKLRITCRTCPIIPKIQLGLF